MEKRGEINLNEILVIGIIILIFGVTFVFAANQVYISDGSASYNISEDITSLYNITVNISADYENITQVQITLPSNFTFDSETNGTKVSAVSNFTNTTTVLSWKNVSAQFLANNTINNITLWFNATSLDPGAYNFTINVTNQTSSALSYVYVTVNDTTLPTGTVSCTPSSPTSADTVTCICSGSDNVGVSTTTMSPASDWPSDRGDHTITCTIVDNAGNSYQANTSYYVYEASGGSTTTGTTTTSQTYVPSANQISKGYTNELKNNERVKLTIASQIHYVDVDGVTTTGATITVSSTPQTVTLAIGEEKKFDVNADDYYDLSVKLNSIASSKANLTIMSINEKIASEDLIDDSNNNDTAPNQSANNNSQQKSSVVWIWSFGIIILIAIIAGVVWYYKKKW